MRILKEIVEFTTKFGTADERSTLLGVMPRIQKEIFGITHEVMVD